MNSWSSWLTCCSLPCCRRRAVGTRGGQTDGVYRSSGETGDGPAQLRDEFRAPPSGVVNPRADPQCPTAPHELARANAAVLTRMTHRHIDSSGAPTTRTRCAWRGFARCSARRTLSRSPAGTGARLARAITPDAITTEAPIDQTTRRAVPQQPHRQRPRRHRRPIAHHLCRRKADRNQRPRLDVRHPGDAAQHGHAALAGGRARAACHSLDKLVRSGGRRFLVLASPRCELSNGRRHGRRQ